MSFVSYSATRCFTEALDSSPMHLSSRTSSTCLCKFSVTSALSASDIVPGAIAAPLLKTTTHNGWGMSLCLFGGGVETRFVCRHTKCDFQTATGITKSARCKRVERGCCISDWRKLELDVFHRDTFTSEYQCKTTVSCSVVSDGYQLDEVQIS